MQVFGNIGSEIKRVEPKKAGGKPFYTFRLAENNGRDEATKVTTWYDVAAFIDELDADLLSKGQFVKIHGRVEARPYSKANGEPAASLAIATGKIEVVERKPRDSASQ